MIFHHKLRTIHTSLFLSIFSWPYPQAKVYYALVPFHPTNNSSLPHHNERIPKYQIKLPYIIARSQQLNLNNSHIRTCKNHLKCSNKNAEFHNKILSGIPLQFLCKIYYRQANERRTHLLTLRYLQSFRGNFIRIFEYILHLLLSTDVVVVVVALRPTLHNLRMLPPHNTLRIGIRTPIFI